MKVLVKASKLLLILSIFSLTIFSCSSEENDVPGLVNLSIALVDAPGDFDSVIIDVEDVFINVSGSDSDWQPMDGFIPGSYDLLKMVNGREWILGETTLPAGKLSQIRLLLGSGNRLYFGDSAVYLPVPSANRSGLKINVQEFLEGGLTYKLILDFDVDKSVLRLGNGDYQLKPVIRGNIEANSGAIKGSIIPSEKVYRIFAARASDTIRTFSNRNGEFLLRALSPGIYDVTVVNEGGLNLTVEEVAIRAGEIKDLGELRIF